MNKQRLITLTDGTDMGGVVIIFQTNAPIEDLKKIEKTSNDIYLNGGSKEDVPIWANEMKNKGYIFDYIDEHQHVTPFGTSTEWLEKKYPQISEHYCIENQPQL